MHRPSKGFTLIELMLAMSGVAFLLIAIALLTIQISNVYTRGVTLKQVNEAGIEISNDLQRGLQGSNDFTRARDYISQDGWGRLCLGRYSYAWNTAQNLTSNEYTAATHQNRYDGDSLTPVRFVKVYDVNKTMCVPGGDEGSEMYPAIRKGDGVTELLVTGDRSLGLHNFELFDDGVEGLQLASLTIGTADGELIEDTRCRPPAEVGDGELYCAVNTFDIVARTGAVEGGSDE